LAGPPNIGFSAGHALGILALLAMAGALLALRARPARASSNVLVGWTACAD
jgi:hypothetical protein